MAVWPIDRATEVLGAWAEWTKDAPEEVTSLGRMLQIPPIPEMPEPLRGRQVVVVEAVFLGSEEAGRELLRPLRGLESGARHVRRRCRRPRSANFTRTRPGRFPEAARAGCWTRSTRPRPTAVVKAAAMDGTAPLISVEVRHLEGALGRPDPNGGVLSHFEAPYAVYSVGWPRSPRPSRRSPGASQRSAPQPRRGSHGARTSISQRRRRSGSLYPEASTSG